MCKGQPGNTEKRYRRLCVGWSLQEKIKKAGSTEKSRERIEKRTAFVTCDIGWLDAREDWESLKCIGAIHTEFEVKGEQSSEWHYYISSRELSAEELLYYARGEWSVEIMHGLLDAHFREEFVIFLKIDFRGHMQSFKIKCEKS